MYIHLALLVIGKYMSKCISINKIKRHIRKFSSVNSANDIYWHAISASNAFSLQDIIEFKENIELYNVLQFNQFNIDEINYILNNFKYDVNIFYVLAEYQQLSDEFINNNIDKFKINSASALISNNAKNMSENTLRKLKFNENLYKLLIKTGKQLSDDFLKDHFKYHESVLYHLSHGVKISENILNSIKISYSDYVSISERIQLSDEFIDKHINSLDLSVQCKNFKLSEYVKDKYHSKIDLHNLCKYQELSLEFIKKYKDIIPWSVACRFQTLDESTISLYKNYVDWQMCYSYQDMSDEFIKTHDSYIKRIIRLYRFNKNMTESQSSDNKE
jgi:hypothetical protein